MKASIIIIGDEILLGQVTDTNSGEIARALDPMGWAITNTQVVPDSADAIYQAVDHAMHSVDLVIVTGGLGPTKDDITKHVLTDYFGGELVFDEAVSKNIDEIFAKRGLQVNEYTRNQALVPTSCQVIQNRLGTAPIMWFELDGRVLVSMPGVPFEMVGMLHAQVLDRIKQRFIPDISLYHHTLILTGISESALAERLSDWEDSLPYGLHLAYLPVPGYIRLRLDGIDVSKEDYDDYLNQLRQLVSDLMLHDGDATPAEILLETLKAHNLTVASAESCTGGNIAHSITSISGASESFVGAVVSYSNDVKHRLLAVSESDLKQYGAVSEPVVSQMATGVCQATGADCSMATSGIAGPSGGTPDKPVGTVWMAVKYADKVVTRCQRFPGSRARVIERATTEAMLMLIKLINNNC